MKRFLPALVLVWVSACDAEKEAPGPIEGTLQIEVLDTVDVRIEPAVGDAMQVTVTAPIGFGLMPEGTPLTADGFSEPIPETGDTLYTAKIAAPATPGGPCGDQPVSLALSLHRQGQNATVLGGISAYCGADTWYGVPARVLRIAGPLPLGP
jgi:hypothetical protein